MDNHRDRPEVAAALARGEGTSVRHSDTPAATRSTPPGWSARRRPLLDPAPRAAALRARRAEGPFPHPDARRPPRWRWWRWSRGGSRAPSSGLSASSSRPPTGMGRGDYAALPDPGTARARPPRPRAPRIARQAGEQIGAVEAERDHLQATVAGLAEGVLVTDARGKVRLRTRPSAESSAYRRAAPTDVLDLARDPRLVDLIQQVLADGAGRSLHLERWSRSAARWRSPPRRSARRRARWSWRATSPSPSS